MRRTSALPVSWVRASIGIVVVIMIQLSVFDQVLVGGLLEVQLPLLMVVAVAMSARPDEAALFGFQCGLILDLFHIGPFGQFALAYCLVAFAIAAGAARRRTKRLDPHSGLQRFGQRCLLGGTAAVASSLIIGGVTIAVAGRPMNPPAVGEWADLGVACGSILLIHPVARVVRTIGILRSTHRIRLNLARPTEPMVAYGPVALGNHD